MSRLRKFLALTPDGRTLFLRSLLLLPTVAALLRIRGLARTSVLLDRLGHRGECYVGAPAPREVARLVDAAAALLRIRCLPRSLVLWHFLRHRGTSAVVRLGVSKLAGGSLSAHAWLELDGVPINDHADVFERYAALPIRHRQLPH